MIDFYERKRRDRIAAITANLPEEMKEQSRWAVYKTYRQRGDGEEKVKKYILESATGKWASATDKTTWSSFTDATSAATRLQAQGLSFCLLDSGYTVIDLDHVFADGQYSELAQKILNLSAGTLTERSVSGTGLHIFLRGKKDDILPGYKTRGDGGLEVFDNKFISVTGNLVSSTNAIAAPSKELINVLKESLGKKAVATTSATNLYRRRDVADENVIKRISRSKVAVEFSSLYDGEVGFGGDHSRADFRLCGILAYFTDGDVAQIKRIFQSSKLYRPEKGDAYLDLTIKNAVATTKYRSKR